MISPTSDEQYMQRALELARKGLGHTSPNPMVGAVIVKDNKIIAEGYHQQAGKDHAEIVALKKCSSSSSKKATLYINLEPCCHHGKTPPCVDSIIASGISKVMIATKDPNPLVSGRGIAALKKAGISVKVGVLQQEAEELNKIFFKYIATGKPYIYLKAALTLDGKIATRTAESKWISGEDARALVHQKRKEVDAILVGKHTLLHDDPHLTARVGRSTSFPKRIILGTEKDVPKNLHIFHQKGENIFRSGKDLTKILDDLGKQEITSILVEGGSSVFSQFIKQGLVDEYLFFIAPKLLGDEQAIPFFQGQNTTSLKEATKLRFISTEMAGKDVLITARNDNKNKKTNTLWSH